MQILVVDQTSEEQTKIARMIEAFDLADRDALDIHVSLASASNFTSKVAQTDVLILGAGLGDSAIMVARQAKEIHQNLEVIAFVSERSYSAEFFRQANLARVRKVIPQNASTLDLLQELVAVQEQFRSSGKAKKGKLIVVTQAKGGIGSTSFIAALAELANEHRTTTMLWDLDIESRDLSRGLLAQGERSNVMSTWIQGGKELTRETLRDTLIPVGGFVSILPPPTDIAAGMDLVGHPDSIKLINRIIELAKVTQDTIIVDTAGKLSPSTGTLLRMADEIIILVDDSLLGLSAAHSYLETILPLIRNNQRAIKILCSGSRLTPAQIAQIFGEHFALPDTAWTLPAMPVDAAAEKWPGTGKSMYGLGQKHTKAQLEVIAHQLFSSNFLDTKIKPFPVQQKQSSPAHWMRMIMKKTSNAV